MHAPCSQNSTVRHILNFTKSVLPKVNRADAIEFGPPSSQCSSRSMVTPTAPYRSMKLIKYASSSGLRLFLKTSTASNTWQKLAPLIMAPTDDLMIIALESKILENSFLICKLESKHFFYTLMFCKINHCISNTICFTQC